MGLSANDLTGLGSVADLAGTVINKIWPDKSKEEAQALANQFAIVQGQLAVNQAEAASPNMFTSGWRPAIGWVCGLALFFQYIARPAVAWYGVVTGHVYPTLPGIDDNLWQLMLGLLGLGSLRTVEKVKGVA